MWCKRVPWALNILEQRDTTQKLTKVLQEIMIIILLWCYKTVQRNALSAKIVLLFFLLTYGFLAFFLQLYTTRFALYTVLLFSTSCMPDHLPGFNGLVGSCLKLSSRLGYSLKNKLSVKKSQSQPCRSNSHTANEVQSRWNKPCNQEITLVSTYRAWQRPVSWSEQSDRATLEIAWKKNISRK